jgi:hypothetical protein
LEKEGIAIAPNVPAIIVLKSGIQWVANFGLNFEAKNNQIGKKIERCWQEQFLISSVLHFRDWVTTSFHHF